MYSLYRIIPKSGWKSCLWLLHRCSEFPWHGQWTLLIFLSLYIMMGSAEKHPASCHHRLRFCNIYLTQDGRPMPELPKPSLKVMPTWLKHSVTSTMNSMMTLKCEKLNLCLCLIDGQVCLSSFISKKVHRFYWPLLQIHSSLLKFIYSTLENFAENEEQAKAIWCIAQNSSKKAQSMTMTAWQCNWSLMWNFIKRFDPHIKISQQNCSHRFE